MAATVMLAHDRSLKDGGGAAAAMEMAIAEAGITPEQIGHQYSWYVNPGE